MIENNARPFLKWAGGKSQLLGQFENYYPERLLEGKIDKYIEPFVGGGAVFFCLQSKYKFKEVILNDINEEIILTYKVIRDNIIELIEILEQLEDQYNKATMEGKENIYYEQRELFNSEKLSIDYSKIAKESVLHAGRMIFLNKTCFNGLYRQNRKGQFNVPFGKRKNVTIYDRNNLRECNKALKGVTLLAGDFQCLLKYVDNNTFVYMDPPYRPLSSTSSFNDYSKEPFNDESQKRLADFAKDIDDAGASFMLSNSDPKNTDPEDNFFEELHKRFIINRVKASRAINSKGSGRGQLNELLIRNNK